MAKHTNIHVQRGVTLIELCVTISIGAILMALAAPSFTRLISENKSTVTANNVMSAMAHARSLAVNTGDVVILCPLGRGGECSESATWQNGWMVCHDTDKDEDCTSTDRVSRTWDVAANVEIHGSEFRIPVRFRPDGSSGGSNQTLRICEERAGSGRSVVLSNVGRARVIRHDFEQGQTCSDFLESRG